MFAQGSDKGCWKTFIAADPLDDFITQAVFVRLSKSDLTEQDEPASNGDSLSAAIAQDQSLLDELARALGECRLTMGEWLAARTPIEARIAQATRELREVTVDSAIHHMGTDIDALRSNWDELSVDRRRAAIKSVMDHAVILKATPGRKTFDSGRVHPVWRR